MQDLVDRARAFARVAHAEQTRKYTGEPYVVHTDEVAAIVAAHGGTPEMIAAARRGQEYLLKRRLFRRRSTGEAIERDRKGGASWARFAFPTWWHYDVLRGLDDLRSAGVPPDARVAEAIERVASKRDRDGRWPLDTRYTGVMPIEMDEVEGQPSRWNTLRALRVLQWHSDGA